MGYKEVGTISNVRFSNIIATGEQGIVLIGSNESVLRDISFENIQLAINYGKFTDINGGNFDLRPANDSKMALFKHDIPAVYATKINNLTIRDFKVSWGPALPGYFTNAVYCDHFNHLVIDGLSASAAPDAAANEVMVSLHNGNDADISNLKPQPGKIKANVAGNTKLVLKDNVTGMKMR